MIKNIQQKAQVIQENLNNTDKAILSNIEHFIESGILNQHSVGNFELSENVTVDDTCIRYSTTVFNQPVEIQYELLALPNNYSKQIVFEFDAEISIGYEKVKNESNKFDNSFSFSNVIFYKYFSEEEDTEAYEIDEMDNAYEIEFYFNENSKKYNTIDYNQNSTIEELNIIDFIVNHISTTKEIESTLLLLQDIDIKQFPIINSIVNSLNDFEDMLCNSKNTYKNKV